MDIEDIDFSPKKRLHYGLPVESVRLSVYLPKLISVLHVFCQYVLKTVRHQVLPQHCHFSHLSSRQLLAP